MHSVPAKLGYRMPAEWEPHEATWIAWPHERTDWPGKFAAIPWVYAEIVRLLSDSERVNILVNDARAEINAKKVLVQVDLNWQRVSFWRIRTDRVWTRDYGPIFIKGVGSLFQAGGNPHSSGKSASSSLKKTPDPVSVVNWQFNGWAKYPNWKHDNAVPTSIAKKLRMRSWEPKVGRRPIVLEGGSIDVNGQGLLLTTEECLLSTVQQRNPGLGRADLEQLLANYLGVRKVLWLGQGIAGDDTHGHIDDLARFVAPGTVVAVVEDNPEDINYRSLQENLDRLRDMTDVQGQRLGIVPLPMPAPVVFQGRRLPASYANFYIANKKILVPTFNDPKDRVALGTLADLFPNREVVGIHAVDLVWGLGTLHCLTQQQPRAVASG
jgi:agmatine deiminase